MSTWVYLRSEPGLWTVGWHAPDGTWHTDSDHGSPDEAAARVRWLNGSSSVSSSDDDWNPDDVALNAAWDAFGQAEYGTDDYRVAMECAVVAAAPLIIAAELERIIRLLEDRAKFLRTTNDEEDDDA